MAIIDFLYSGEANVYQENLDTFLAIAAELQLKGLTGEQEFKENEPRGAVPQNRNEAFPQIPQTSKSKRQPPTKPETAFYSETNGTVSLLKTTVDPELNQLEEQIKSMMDSTENFMTRKNGRRMRTYICKVCGKEGEERDVSRHIEANHISNLSHSCDICGKTSRSRNGLRQHIATVHNH